MQMALQLVDGRLDSSQYEDSVRQLLGIASLMHQPTFVARHGKQARQLHAVIGAVIAPLLCA